jgi:TolB-like protein
MLAWNRYHTRRFDESIALHRQVIRNEPNYAWVHLTFSWLLRCAGQHDEAIAEARKGVEFSGGENPMYLTALAAAQAGAGRRDEARATLARINKIAAGRYVSPFMLATVYCALNDKEQAFAELERALAERDVWIVWLGVDPQFDSLHGDERFGDLLKRANHPLAGRFAASEISRPSVALAAASARSEQKSIAVLPLRFLGEAEADDAYLAIGLADAMITRLSKVRRLIVRPTSSVLRFGETEDVFAAGRELGVDFVLCGTIRPAGARIRITGQLLDVAAGAVLWTEKFDEDFTDVLELEDTISEKVAHSLIPRLTGEERRRLDKRGTNSPEAYEAYLGWRIHWTQFTHDSLL